MRKLLVSGSRDIVDTATVHRIIGDTLAQIPSIDTIIHGGCRGVDSMCDSYSDRYEIIVVEPNWRKHGRSAGPIRNRLMVDMADVVLVIFSDLNRMSPGTKSTYDYALNQGKETHVHSMKDKAA